jgi:hypothetical protein
MTAPCSGRVRRALAAGFLAGALIACGGGTAAIDAPPPPTDAADVDAPPPTDAGVDAPVDAPTDAPPPPTRTELTGGGRLTGGTLVMDVQLGHPISQAPASGGTTVADPASPIKP